MNRLYGLLIHPIHALQKSHSQDGHECLRWKDAIEGGNGLNGVGLDNIDYGKHLFVKEYLGLWKKLYHARDTASMTPERRDLISLASELSLNRIIH